MLIYSGRALKAEFTMICSLRLIWAMQDLHRGSFQVTSLLLWDTAAMAMRFLVFQEGESITCDDQSLFSLWAMISDIYRLFLPIMILPSRFTKCEILWLVNEFCGFAGLNISFPQTPVPCCVWWRFGTAAFYISSGKKSARVNSA